MSDDGNVGFDQKLRVLQLEQEKLHQMLAAGGIGNPAGMAEAKPQPTTTVYRKSTGEPITAFRVDCREMVQKGIACTNLLDCDNLSDESAAVPEAAAVENVERCSLEQLDALPMDKLRELHERIVGKAPHPRAGRAKLVTDIKAAE